MERRAEGGTGPQEAPPQQSRPGWELWQKGHSEAKERPRRVAMAQKSLQGRWVGRRCPTSCHIIGKGKAPRNSLEQAQEGPRTLLCHQGRWPDLATPGLPSFLCFHPSTGGCEGTFQKDHRGASPVGGEQERQRAKASLCRPRPPPSCCQLKGRAVLEDSCSSGLPTGGREGFAKGQSLPETQKQEVRAYRGASPPAFLLRAGDSQGTISPRV